MAQWVEASLREVVESNGFHAVEAASPKEGLAALERDSAVALVISDVRMPTTASGVEFVRGAQIEEVLSLVLRTSRPQHRENWGRGWALPTSRQRTGTQTGAIQVRSLGR